MTNIPLPSREEAQRLLTWGHDQNPGPWAEHCRVVARAAETIARAVGLDENRAYISGLLHDIGKIRGQKRFASYLRRICPAEKRGIY